MKQQLADLGYTPEDTRRLDPERARVIIDKSLPRPSKGVPSSWVRGASRGEPLAGVRKVIGGIARAMLIAGISIPVLYDPVIRGRHRDLDRRYDATVAAVNRWITGVTARPVRQPVYVDTSPRRRRY